MRPQKIFDAIVIGGGLAGSAIAYHLASHPYSVALVEREDKAHHKVCGEFLTQETLPYLQELGVDLDSLQASSLKTFSFHSSHFESQGSFDAPARGLSRYVLDEVCLEKAQQAGCLIFRGEMVQSYEKDSSELFHLKTSQRILKAKTLFLATGKHELKKVNIREGLENSAIAFKMHYQLTEVSQKKLNQNIALFFFKGGYGGLSHIENQIANFCFIIDKKRFRELGNAYELVLSSLQKENSSLAHFLQNASSLWPKPLAMSGLPYGYLFKPKTSVYEKGIYPLGDQFAVIPSLTGSGMAIALYTARKAFLNYQQNGNLGVEDYANECFQAIESRMRLAYPFHTLTRSPLLANTAIAALKIIPPLAEFLIRKTRMPQLSPSQY